MDLVEKFNKKIARRATAGEQKGPLEILHGALTSDDSGKSTPDVVCNDDRSDDGPIEARYDSALTEIRRLSVECSRLRRGWEGCAAEVAEKDAKIHSLMGEVLTWKGRAEFEEAGKKSESSERNREMLEKEAAQKRADYHARIAKQGQDALAKAEEANRELREHINRAVEEVSKCARETVLEEAARITSVDRQGAYGGPEDSFGLIANLWTDYLDARGYMLTPRDVAKMMVLLKIARDTTGKPKRDNLVDIAGYARCAEMVDHYESRREHNAQKEG